MTGVRGEATDAQANYSELSLDRNLLTFPVYATLPPVCFYTGQTSEIEYVWQDFEYLPGTAPGGAEPKVKRTKIQIPLSRSAARTKSIEGTLWVIALIASMYSTFANLNPLVHLSIAIPAMVVLVKVGWKRVVHNNMGLECMKIEGDEGVERVTLQIVSHPAAEALRAFLNEHRIACNPS